MLQKSVLAFALFTASVAAAHAAGGPRYDGKFMISRYLTAACSAVTDVPSVWHTAIFRSVTSGSNLPEALQITVALGDLYVQAELDGTLAGTNQLVTGAFTVDAYRSGLPDAVFNVKFNPPVINDTVNSFAFVGTWANYREPNCKAAVRGKFTKRP